MQALKRLWPKREEWNVGQTLSNPMLILLQEQPYETKHPISPTIIELSLDDNEPPPLLLLQKGKNTIFFKYFFPCGVRVIKPWLVKIEKLWKKSSKLIETGNNARGSQIGNTHQPNSVVYFSNPVPIKTHFDSIRWSIERIIKPEQPIKRSSSRTNTQSKPVRLCRNMTTKQKKRENKTIKKLWSESIIDKSRRIDNNCFIGRRKRNLFLISIFCILVSPFKPSTTISCRYRVTFFSQKNL